MASFFRRRAPLVLLQQCRIAREPRARLGRTECPLIARMRDVNDLLNGEFVQVSADLPRTRREIENVEKGISISMRENQ